MAAGQVLRVLGVLETYPARLFRDGGCRTLRVFVADIGGVASLGPRLLRPVVAAFAMTLLRHYLRAVIAPLPQSPTNR